MKCNSVFVKAYLDAIWFTESCKKELIGTEGEIDRDASVSDIAPESLAKIEKDCQEFLKKTDSILKRANNVDEPTTGYCTLEQAGHDFWLTRNGHGAGFWDGDWPETGDELDAIAKTFNEQCVCTGDDGLIYVQ